MASEFQGTKEIPLPTPPIPKLDPASCHPVCWDLVSDVATPDGFQQERIFIESQNF